MSRETMRTLSSVRIPMRPIKEEDLVEVEGPRMVTKVDMVITIEDHTLAKISATNVVSWDTLLIDV